MSLVRSSGVLASDLGLSTWKEEEHEKKYRINAEKLYLRQGVEKSQLNEGTTKTTKKITGRTKEIYSSKWVANFLGPPCAEANTTVIAKETKLCISNPLYTVHTGTYVRTFRTCV